jgi:hypothetical protein
MRGVKASMLSLTIACALALGGSRALAEASAKNWTPPVHKIYAQVLSDETMTKHPELLSVTFHGVPPGQSDAYTMFAGSYPERIGNPDDPDDIDVSKKGITIIDPRWHRTKDTDKKFVVLMPLRDAARQNIGLIVYAFKSPADDHKTEVQYFAAATALRDALEPRIKTYVALFEPAK